MARSRYPRQGHRLAPATLRELLHVPVPAKYLKGSAQAGMLLSALDETAWERFGESTCRELAEEVVRTVGHAARMPLCIGARRIPRIPRGLTLADLDLEVRTLNCLVAAGIHERPQDLHAMTIDGILGLRGFWVKSLVDLLSSLEYVIDHPAARKTLRTDAGVTIKHLRAAHRYPRPGHRLAPQTLKEVLLVRVPPRLVRGTPFRNARFCDLDETVWNHLSPETIGRLAGLVIVRAGLGGHHRAIRQRHLPRPPKGMRLEDLRLENRTHNCLVREGLADRPEELGELSVGDLLAIRAFGTKCLVDLLTSLETRVAREGKLDRELTAQAKALGRTAEAARVQFTDPRLGSLLRAMDTESNTIGEMAERLVRRRLDPPDPPRLCAQLRELQEKIRELKALPLEEELVQIFAPACGGRDRQIVAEYYGWDGQGGRTLEQLGNKYRLSRERIRQVCVRAIKRSRDTRVFAPVLDRAIEFLSQRFPKALDCLQAEFDATGLSACRLSVGAVQQAAKFLSRQVPFVIVDVGRGRLAVEPKFARLPRLIVRAARQAVANYGAGTTGDVAAELAAHSVKSVGRALICETLQTISDFHWLDAQRTWFRLDSLPQYGLPNIVEKVLSVTGRIEAARLRAAIGRYRRSSRQLPPARVLLEFCRQMPGTRIEKSTIISDPPRDWRKTLAGVERNMVQVLKKHGPVMERNAFEELCTRSGMNRFSFNAIVMCSPVVAQYGRSVYGLLGAKVERKTIEALLARKPGALPARVLKGFGQTKEGATWLAYRLSKAAISGGVVTVPAALKRKLRGRFTLRTPEGRHVGTLVTKSGCGWGLGPALRGSKAREGDHMLLVIDTERREARIRIGDESILKEVNRP